MICLRKTVLPRAATIAVVLALLGGLVLAGLSADDIGLAVVWTIVCVVALLRDQASIVSHRLTPVPIGPHRSPASPRAPPLPA